jgi:hypothetical protein
VNQTSPQITSVDLVNSTPPVAGAAATIEATVGTSPTVNAATLYYTTVEDGAHAKVAMTLTAPGQYQGEIPGQLAGTKVYYYIEA